MSTSALFEIIKDRITRDTKTNTVPAGIDIDSTGEALGGHPAAREAFTVNSQNNDSCPLSEDPEQGSLLPGLPDAVTLDRIVPKLSWRAFPILLSVSPAWQQAIQSRQAYNTRVCTNSTNTLVVLNHHSWRKSATEDAFIPSIALYSPRDKSFYPLPHILGPSKKVPSECECVSLDGKLYLLGGTGEHRNVSSYVYVFDLVRLSGWKECAHMRERRKGFGCAAKDGKIYVFGGSTIDQRHSNGCEVYDPKLDSWSSITPMTFSRHGQHVAIVGEEIFVHGGIVGPYGDDQMGSDAVALFSEVYHPGQDEWRLVGPFGWQSEDRLFSAQGKLHLMTPSGIHVHDSNTDGDSCSKINTHGNSWTKIHSFSWDESESEDFPDYHNVHAIHAVNGELLASVDRHFGPYGEREVEKIIFQSKGFGSETKELVWVKVDCSLELQFSGAIHLCPIEL